MAVGTTAAMLIAGGAFVGTSQVMAGQAQAKEVKRQSEYNAQVYGQQAEMISQKKKIQDYQFNRNLARARGSIIAQTAKKGMMLSGSPLAILADTESEMQFDKAIQDYNLSIESGYANSAASYMTETGKAKARLAKYQGYGNAFSTMLTTGLYAGKL